MTAYGAVLVAHSWLRWLALLSVASALVVTLRRRAHGRRYRPLVLAIAIAAVDSQILLGAILWIWLSPFARAFRDDPGAMMRVAPFRFFGVEHAFGMTLAFVAIHVGAVVARRRAHAEGGGPSAHRAAAIACTVWLLLAALSVPWPGLPYARPLVRIAPVAGPR